MLNVTFGFVIFALCAIGIIGIFFNWKSIKNTMPNIVVSLGMFGTFLGIFFGLQEFDIKNIDNSIPALLEGLKTAFITSIFGMIAYIILKFAGMLKKNKVKGINQEATFETMIRILNEINDASKENNDFSKKSIELQIKALIQIKNSIAGDGDTTLLTQIQKLRTTTSDRLEELNNSFKEFANKMVENNTQALIDALTQVMADFNAKINEQFGENFKQLNDAVGRMLEWQKEYSARIETMIGQFQKTIETVEKCDNVMNSITDKAFAFSKVSENLQILLENLNTNLIAIDNLKESVKNALPAIQDNINNLTIEFANAVNDSTQKNTELRESFSQTVKQMIEQNQNSAKNLVNAVTDIENERTQSIQKINANIEQMTKENTERIIKQISNLDKQLGDELTKSISTLGSQLASLSQKFVNDYSPLTEKLQRLVQVSQNLNMR